MTDRSNDDRAGDPPDEFGQRPDDSGGGLTRRRVLAGAAAGVGGLAGCTGGGGGPPADSPPSNWGNDVHQAPVIVTQFSGSSLDLDLFRSIQWTVKRSVGRLNERMGPKLSFATVDPTPVDGELANELKKRTHHGFLTGLLRYAASNQGGRELPPGSHLIVVHDVSPRASRVDSGNTDIYNRDVTGVDVNIQAIAGLFEAANAGTQEWARKVTFTRSDATASVKVDGEWYHGTSMPSVKGMQVSNTRAVGSRIDENWEARQMARQAVGHVLGAHHRDGGYSLLKRGAKETETRTATLTYDDPDGTILSTVTDISPMATGHCYDSKLRRDTKVNYFDPPALPPMVSYDKYSDELQTFSGITLYDQDRYSFRGGRWSDLPVRFAVHPIEDPVLPEKYPAKMGPHHTKTYTDRTVSAIEETLTAPEELTRPDLATIPSLPKGFAGENSAGPDRWNTVGANVQGTGYNPASYVPDDDEIKEQWRHQVVGGPTLVKMCAGSFGPFYIAGGTLVSLSTGGEVRWKQDGVTGAPAYSDGGVFCFKDGRPAKFAASDGSLQWTGGDVTALHEGQLDDTRPTVVGDRVFFSDWLGIFAATVGKSGFDWSMWNENRRYSSPRKYPPVPPVVNDNTVLFTTHDSPGISGVMGLDAATGDQVWDGAVAPVPGGVAGSRNSEPYSRIVTYDDKVYAPANTGELTVIDIASGDPVWELHEGDRTAVPAVADDVLFLASYKGAETPYLHAIDAQEGHAYWHKSLGSHLRFQPAIADGKIVLAMDDRLLALDAENAGHQWSLTLDGAIAHQPVLWRQTVYVTNGAEIIAFNDSQG